VRRGTVYGVGREGFIGRNKKYIIIFFREGNRLRLAATGLYGSLRLRLPGFLRDAWSRGLPLSD
jgi:hypothetical protein